MSKIISDTIQGRSKDPNVNAGFTIAGVTTATGVINASSDVRISGNINAGIASFTSIAGDGSALTGVANTDFIVSVAQTTSRLTVNSDANIVGVSTFTGAIDANAGLDVDGQSDLDEVVVAGVSTFNNTVDINAGLDVDGQSDLDEVVVAGVSTFSSLVDVNNRLDVVGGANIDQANVSGVSTLTGNVSFASSASFANTKQLYFGDSLRIFSRTDGAEVDTSLQNPKGDIEIQGGQINIGNIGTGLTITGTYAGFTTSNVSL